MKLSHLGKGSGQSSNGAKIHRYRQSTHECEQVEYEEVSRGSSEVGHEVESEVKNSGCPDLIWHITNHGC